MMKTNESFGGGERSIITLKKLSSPNTGEQSLGTPEEQIMQKHKTIKSEMFSDKGITPNVHPMHHTSYEPGP